MSLWLRSEEAPFSPEVAAQPMETADRRGARRPTVTVSLRGVTVLDNKKLFGSASVRVLAVVVDGNRDTNSGAPFWSSELSFANVRDGAKLSIDPELGVVIYRGKPWGFLSLFVLVARDTDASRAFAKALEEGFLAKGIGTAAGAATIFAGAPIAAGAAREVTTAVVTATLDVFAERKDPVIGTYYGSVTKEQHYGEGLHPSTYPAELIDCGGAAQLAYEVAGP